MDFLSDCVHLNVKALGLVEVTHDWCQKQNKTKQKEVTMCLTNLINTFLEFSFISLKGDAVIEIFHMLVCLASLLFMLKSIHYLVAIKTFITENTLKNLEKIKAYNKTERKKKHNPPPPRQ